MNDHDNETTPPAEKNSYGSVFSILLMLVVLVAGAWYVWHKRIAESYPQPTPQVQTP